MSKCLVAAALVALVAPASSRAASVLAVTEPELVAQAHTVAVANVIAIRTVTTKLGQVVTHADVQILRAIKGQKALDVITLQVPGGKLPNGVLADVPGAPSLRVGQVVLGFLEERDGNYRPLGLSFGLLDVKTIDGEERVFRNLENLHLVNPRGGDVQPGKFVVQGEPLDAMLKRLVAHAQLPSRPGGVLR